MLKKPFASALSLILVIIMLLGLCLCAFGADAPTDGSVATAADLYKNPEGRLMCASNQGDTLNYPENSVEGIMSAVNKGADIVEVSVKRTSDGVFILFADDDFSRMCVDPLGKTITAKVSETERWEVIAMKLRASHGGEAAAVTDFAPPTLEDAINAVRGKALLLINFDWKQREDIYSLVVSLSALDTVIFKADGEKSSLTGFIKEKGVASPLTMGGYSGNMVLSARSYVKKVLKGGSYASVLTVKNPYGVIFSDSVLSLFSGKGRAVADMTKENLCGGRQDDEVGWNDLTKRGYSVIITNYPERLKSYIDETENERSALTQEVEKIKASDLTPYSSESLKILNKQLKNAEKMLETSFSKQSLNEQYYTLQSAFNSLESRTDGDNGTGRTVSGGRIVAAVIIAAVFAFSQVYLYSDILKKRRRKKQ